MIRDAYSRVKKGKIYLKSNSEHHAIPYEEKMSNQYAVKFGIFVREA